MDLKPLNIMVEGNVATILDFGGSSVSESVPGALTLAFAHQECIKWMAKMPNANREQCVIIYNFKIFCILEWLIATLWHYCS